MFNSFVTFGYERSQVARVRPAGNLPLTFNFTFSSTTQPWTSPYEILIKDKTFTFSKDHHLHRPWIKESSISCGKSSFTDHYSITHHPQNEFEKPLTALNCFVVIDETPPKIDEYGNLCRHWMEHVFALTCCVISLNASNSLESKGIYGDAHVTRLVGTRIQISVIHRQQVNVVEHEAIPFVELQRLNVSDIHQFRSIERSVHRLLNYEYSVIDLLSHQKRMQILEKDRQVLLAVAKWNDNSHTISRSAVWRLVSTAKRDFVSEFLFYVFKILRLSVDLDRTDQVGWHSGALIQTKDLHDATQNPIVRHKAGIEILVFWLLHHRPRVLDLMVDLGSSSCRRFDYIITTAIVSYVYGCITMSTIKFNITIFAMKIFCALRIWCFVRAIW